MAEDIEKKPKKNVSIALQKEGATLEEATTTLATLGKALSEAEANGWEITDYGVNTWS